MAEHPLHDLDVDTRSGGYNRVFASTGSTDRPDVVGTAELTAGAMSVNGPYGVVTKELSSPLLTTQAQARAAAQADLANSSGPAQAVPVRIAPDPRIELDDPVEVLRGARGRIVTVPAVTDPAYVPDPGHPGTFIPGSP